MFQSKAEAAGYLAGIIDGEGSVIQVGALRHVVIVNTDRGLLDATEAALDRLGIEWRERDRSERSRLGRRPIFEIVISRRETLEKLLSAVRLHTVKGPKLEAMLASYGPRSRRNEALALLASGLSKSEVARRMGVSKSNVWYWEKNPEEQPRGRPRGRRWSEEERRRRAIGGGG